MKIIDVKTKKKKVIIISSSMRKGNSDKLCDKFQEGAIASGNIVTRINIRDIRLNFCLGCRDCYNYGDCVQNDDMNNIYPKIKKADVLVFATPIYFGEMSGSLKTFLDRLYPLYTSISGKVAYIIASCYEDDHTFVNDSIVGLKRTLSDFGINNIKQVIYGLGTDGPNDVREETLEECLRAGQKI
jgi:multimeric flavodoxin WrbA